MKKPGQMRRYSFMYELKKSAPSDDLLRIFKAKTKFFNRRL